jgi:hypothetical protein
LYLLSQLYQGLGGLARDATGILLGFHDDIDPGFSDAGDPAIIDIAGDAGVGMNRDDGTLDNLGFAAAGNQKGEKHTVSSL